MTSILVGYAAVFDQETIIASAFRESIAPGAFREAVGRDDVRALFNHDPNIVLGRTASGTLRLFEDARGLRYELDLNPADPIAQGIAASIRRGDISGSSFSFSVDPADERWTAPSRGLPLRRIMRASLHDIAPVTFPAYGGTSVSARATADPISMGRLYAAKSALARTRLFTTKAVSS